MEPWEALDLDDSDLPSLLRPSKRHHPHPQPPSSSTTSTSATAATTTTATFSRPFLKHCFQSQHYSDDAQSLPATCPFLIPGPAGAAQAAMHRKSQNQRTFLVGGEDPIPTQEYIRRVVEDGGFEEDSDFTDNPWLCAVDFVREGMVGDDGVAIGTPLCSIKNGVKVAQVVAIIKSSTPNGLGDLMVTLKDPTGTVGASIHSKVLSEGEFGKDISVGAVLILGKVAVFSPSRSIRYLNITLSNVIKVISKDSEPPPKQNYPPSTVTFADPGTESSEILRMPQKQFSMSQGRTEGIMSDLRRDVSVRGNVHNDIHMENDNAASQIGYCDDGSNRSKIVVREKEALRGIHDVVSVVRKLSTRIDTNDNDRRVLVDGQHGSWNQVEVSNPSGSTQCNATGETSVEICKNHEIGNVNGTSMQVQPILSKTALLQWTDEQLDELFAFDC